MKTEKQQQQKKKRRKMRREIKEKCNKKYCESLSVCVYIKDSKTFSVNLQKHDDY